MGGTLRILGALRGVIYNSFLTLPLKLIDKFKAANLSCGVVETSLIGGPSIPLVDLTPNSATGQCGPEQPQKQSNRQDCQDFPVCSSAVQQL